MGEQEHKLSYEDAHSQAFDFDNEHACFRVLSYRI